MPKAARKVTTVADAAYDWQSWVDTDGSLRWVNPAVTRLTGYSPSECFAMPDYPLPIIAAEDREWMAEVLSAAQKGSAGNDLEVRIRRKDGPLRYVTISWQAVGDTGYHATIRDITQRKRREDRWKAARREAAASDRAKTLFLANLSHEMRQSLQCILGSTDLLKGTGDKEHWLEVIEEQANGMVRQMQDLLHFVAADAIALRLRAVDLPRLCENALQDVAPRLAPRGVATTFAVDADVPRWVLADRDRLEHMVGNVVAHALRSTFEGSVAVRVSCDDLRRIVIDVRDTGEGIKPEVLGATQQSSSAGLGLAAADSLARMMGGTVTVESDVGRGTSVRIVLPLTPTEPEPAESDPRLGRSLNVLVVDDSEPGRELAVAMLASLGCSAQATPCPEEAEEAALHGKVDLILMDYRLSGRDGLDEARKLKAKLLDAKRKIAIVLVTADAFVDVGDDPDPPVDHVARKPLRRAELEEILALAVTGKKTNVQSPKRRKKKRSALLDPKLVAELRAVRDSSGASLFRRIGRKVLASVAAVLAQLEAERGDLYTDRARILAHRAKGDCLTIGARAAAEAAAALEDGIQARSTLAPHLLEALSTSWAETIVWLQTALEDDEAS